MFTAIKATGSVLNMANGQSGLNKTRPVFLLSLQPPNEPRD